MLYGKTMIKLGLGPQFVSVSPLCLINKACTRTDRINIMKIRIKNVFRTEQSIFFIFVRKLIKRTELSDVIEHNRVTTRKITF